MQWSVFRRIAVYIVTGVAIGMGILATRTFPYERTWVDEASRWLDDRQFEEARRPRTFRKDCGWRLVGCEPLPSFTGHLGPVADSILRGLDHVECVPAMTWEAYEEDIDREIYCADIILADQFDHATYGIATRRDGRVGRVIHAYGSDVDRSEFQALKEKWVASYGVPTICPPESEVGRSVHLRWEIGSTVFTLGHTNYDGLSESWEPGPLRCLSEVFEP